MRLFGEIGGATLELWKGPEVNISGHSCSDILKKILNAWKLLLCYVFRVCSNFFCTLRYIVRQRVYAIIYSKRSLIRLCPLPSNNELSAEKAYFSFLNRDVHLTACDF